MTPELHAAVMALPVADKWKLIEDLDESLAEAGYEPPAELVAEVERRAAAFAADPSGGMTIDEVLAQAHAQHAR